jgi:predicted lysophospholipase L1 biosynthesis ABC-type transport system permease subunit
VTRILFYLSYAARNLRRNLRWTLFAIFCIAAGVATIVALRSLGLAIGDSLTDSARVSNRGDITLTTFRGGFGDFGGDQDDSNSIRPRIIEAIEMRVTQLGGEFSSYSVLSNLQVTAVDAVTVGRPQFITSLLIDPTSYPPAGEILLEEPANTPLRNVFKDNAIVISRNLADQQGLSVGDTVRVSGAETLFTVVGIVATEQEAGLRNLFASFFGFVYLDRAQASNLGLGERPNAISMSLPAGADIDALALEFASLAPGLDISTVNDVLRENATIADAIGSFIVIMGLGALLLGGVGIINTMLVMVGRRTTEIAALKTFGLKGGQVSLLFLAEAFLLGLLGCLVGCAVGVLLSGAVNAYGEAFLQQRLQWRLYPEALLYGVGLGMVVTMVFGLLPVLTANRIRPATILRPNEAQLPGASVFHALLVLLLVIFIVGGIAGQILGSVWVGIIGTAIALLIMGIIVGQMWLVVWGIGRLPSFGNVDLKLAFRNLTARRIRTATTLMALSTGMFALSFITFVGAGTREVLNFQLTQNLGGDVLVFPLSEFLGGSGSFNTQLDAIDGVQYRTQLESYNVQLTAVNGETPNFELAIPEFLLESIPEEERADLREDLARVGLQLQVRNTDNPNPIGQIVAGRALSLEDRGRAVMVVPDNTLTRQLGLTVGSQVTITEDRRPFTFEVIGISGSASASFFNTGEFSIPPGVLPDDPDFSFYVLQTQPNQLNNVLLELTANPLNFAIDISFIDGLVQRFIEQFSAIPTVVGLLSLLTAAVTMANTVSLATLERRRQIGVLKAVGLKTDRVLGVMLIENTVIGLLGSLLGVGLSALAVALFTQLSTGTAIPIPRDATVVAVVLVLVSVIIAWVATLLSAAPAARESVTSVLRYE